MNFIKVLDPKLQQEFADLGFSYTIENFGDKQIYAFADSKELKEYIESMAEGTIARIEIRMELKNND